MIPSELKTNYSAEIRLRLEADGKSWPISKLGPDGFFPTHPLELDPCAAEIIMTVDGDEHRWKVRLIDGAVPFDSKVRIVYEKQ